MNFLSIVQSQWSFEINTAWSYFGFFLAAPQGILVPRPEVKPMLPTLEAQSLNHQNTRDAQGFWLSEIYIFPKE